MKKKMVCILMAGVMASLVPAGVDLAEATAENGLRFWLFAPAVHMPANEGHNACRYACHFFKCFNSPFIKNRNC